MPSKVIHQFEIVHKELKTFQRWEPESFDELQNNDIIYHVMVYAKVESLFRSTQGVLMQMP